MAKRPPGSTCPLEVRRGPASCALPGRAFTSRRLRLELLERDFLRRYTEKNLRTVNFFMLSSIAPRPAARSRRAGGRASLAHPRPGSARAGTRAGEPDAVALGADAGCKHKGQAARATGPDPRITPAAPSPPARSTSSWQSAPPIDYAQRRSDQTESAAAPRPHAHPPISVRGWLSFSFSPITHYGPPHPHPAHHHHLQSAQAVLPRGVVPVTASNQRPPPTPPSPTTPALAEPHSAVSPRLPPRPLPRPPISAHARWVPNQPLLPEARGSGPLPWPHLSELLWSPLNTPLLLDHPPPQSGIMHSFAEQNLNDSRSGKLGSRGRSSRWSLQPLLWEPLEEDPACISQCQLPSSCSR